MAITGFTDKKGRNQLECKVKPTFLCKIGVHFPRKKEDFGKRRCVHCNHLK